MMIMTILGKKKQKWPKIFFLGTIINEIPASGRGMVRGKMSHFVAFFVHFDKLIRPHPGPLWGGRGLPLGNFSHIIPFFSLTTILSRPPPILNLMKPPHHHHHHHQCGNHHLKPVMPPSVSIRAVRRHQKFRQSPLLQINPNLKWCTYYTEYFQEFSRSGSDILILAHACLVLSPKDPGCHTIHQKAKIRHQTLTPLCVVATLGNTDRREAGSHKNEWFFGDFPSGFWPLTVLSPDSLGESKIKYFWTKFGY